MMATLPIDETTRQDILETTYDLDMFKVDFDNKFELTSGNMSPLYIDGRLWTQDPETADLFVSALQSGIQDADIEYDVIGGGVTAGVPYAERVAQEMSEPSMYIRSKPKGYGQAAQIEGREDFSGETVLLFEDLITNGGSKLEFVDGVERAGGTINDCITFYNREQGGEETLADRDVQLYSVISVTDLMEYGQETGRISADQYDQLNDYLDNTVTL